MKAMFPDPASRPNKMLINAKCLCIYCDDCLESSTRNNLCSICGTQQVTVTVHQIGPNLPQELAELFNNSTISFVKGKGVRKIQFF